MRWYVWIEVWFNEREAYTYTSNLFHRIWRTQAYQKARFSEFDCICILLFFLVYWNVFSVCAWEIVEKKQQDESTNENDDEEEKKKCS